MEDLKHDKDEVNEPDVNYIPQINKRIAIFKSPEEAEEATIQIRAQMSPEERLSSVTQMLMRLYEVEIRQSEKPTRIIFDS